MYSMNILELEPPEIVAVGGITNSLPEGGIGICLPLDVLFTLVFVNGIISGSFGGATEGVIILLFWFSSNSSSDSTLPSLSSECLRLFLISLGVVLLFCEIFSLLFVHVVLLVSFLSSVSIFLNVIYVVKKVHYQLMLSIFLRQLHTFLDLYMKNHHLINH